MQRKFVTLVLTPPVLAVWKAHDATLNTIQEVSLPADEKQGKSMGANVKEAVLYAECGALGGQKGVLVAGLYAGISSLADKVYEYFSPTKVKSVPVMGLGYLDPKIFTNNKNLCRTNTNDRHKIAKARLEKLQSIYNFCCDYQRGKDGRSDTVLGRLIEGKRSDDTFNDCKYLTNSIAAQEILLAAEARSFEEYQDRLTRLFKFLEAVANIPEVLESRSNDTSTASLRTVIINSKAMLLDELNNCAETKIDGTAFAEKLANEIEDVTKTAEDLIDQTRAQLTNLLSPLNGVDLFDLAHANRASKNLPNPNDTPYHQMLAEVLYSKHKLTNAKLDAFMKGMYDYTGVTLNYDAKKIMKECFNQVVEQNQRLQILLQTLNLLENIKKDGGLLALLTVSKQLENLLAEIKKTQNDLVDSRKVFVKALHEHYCESVALRNMEFKNRFTKNGYQIALLNSNNKNVNDAILTVKEINLNKEAIVANITANIDSQVKAFDDAVNEITKESKVPSIAPAKPLEHNTVVVDEGWLRDVLEAECNKGAAKEDIEELAKSVAPEVQQLSWFPGLFLKTADKAAEIREADLKREIAEHKTTISKLKAATEEQQRKIGALEHEKAAALREKTAALGEKTTAEERATKAENAVMFANTARDRAQDQLNSITRIKTCKAVFKEFIKDYAQHNKDTSSWNYVSFGIFGNRHGQSGLDAAEFISAKFSEMIKLNHDLLQRKNANQIYNEVRNLLIQLLERHSDKLNGKYNPHSLKTYLLAYSQYLNSNSNTQANLDLVKTFHHNQYVGAANKNKNIESFYHDGLGIEKATSCLDCFKF